MDNLGPTIGLVMLGIFGTILCIIAIFADNEVPKHKHSKHKSS